VSNLVLALLDRSYPWRTKAYAAILFLLSAFTDGWLIRRLLLGTSPGVATVSLFGLVIALLFCRPRLGCSIAVLSGLVALYWFSRLELGNFPALNSWILFNLPDTVPSLDEPVLRVTFGAALVGSTVCSLIALLPAKWHFRGEGRSGAYLAITCHCFDSNSALVFSIRFALSSPYLCRRSAPGASHLAY